MSSALILLCVFATALACAGGARADGYPDLRGMYSGGACIGGALSDCEANNQFPHTKNITSEDFNTGTIVGDGFTGQITGCTLVNHTGTPGGYQSTETETISQDGNTLSGTFTDTNGHSGPIFDFRNSGGPSTCPPGPTSTKRPSGTSVQCNYDTFMQSFSCTAQVGDASGHQPSTTPTGSVAFVIDSGANGSFPQGSSCALRPSTSGPTAFCSVTYLPGQQGVPSGTEPRLSATYSGDSTFASSSGRPTNQYGSGPPPKPKTCKVSPARAARDFNAAVKRSRPGTVTAGGHAPRRARKLSRRQADRRAVALLRAARRTARPGGLVLYGLASPLRAGSQVTEAPLGLPARSLLPALQFREPAWVYWEDLGPSERFTHPSVVIAVAAKGGRLLARASFITYPVVNGRPAVFVTSRKRRVILRRGSTRRAVHVSAAALARLRALSGVPIRGLLAHVTDVSKSTLITIVDHSSHGNGQTFVNEEHAITNVFASHGVPTQAAHSVSELNTAVDEAAAAGRTSVTVFIDGHGLTSSQVSVPSVYLGFPADAAGNVLAPGKDPPIVLTSSDLAGLAQAHPEVKFNFIIDSCYSGRFAGALSTEPNVASVTTSSAADQRSSSPLDLVPAKPDNPFKMGEVVLPSGKKVDVEIAENVDDHISPFTTGEVAALKQAFIGKSPGADVTAIVQDARTLEPSYDLAAIDGQTNPSPDPGTPGAACQEPPGPADPSPPTDWFTNA